MYKVLKLESGGTGVVGVFTSLWFKLLGGKSTFSRLFMIIALRFNKGKEA